MIRVNNLQWEPDIQTGNPIAIITVDFTTDTEWLINLDSYYQDRSIHANAITVNNLPNSDRVAIQIGPSWTATVIGNARRTYAVPSHGNKVLITGVSGATVQVIFQVVYSAQGDDTDFGTIQQQGQGTLQFVEVNKNGTNQTGIIPATNVIVTFSTPVVDTFGGSYDFLNAKFIPAVSGWFVISAAIRLENNIVDQQQYSLNVEKNGTAVGQSGTRASGTGFVNLYINWLVSLNGTTDYVQLSVFANGAGDKMINGVPALTYFRAMRIG